MCWSWLKWRITLWPTRKWKCRILVLGRNFLRGLNWMTIIKYQKWASVRSQVWQWCACNSSEHGRSLRSMSDCGPVSLGEAVRLGTKDVSPALSLILGNDVTPQFLNHIDNHMVKLSKWLWRKGCWWRLVSARLVSHTSLCTQTKYCCVTTNELFSRLQHWMIEMPCLLIWKGLSEL